MIFHQTLQGNKDEFLWQNIWRHAACMLFPYTKKVVIIVIKHDNKKKNFQRFPAGTWLFASESIIAAIRRLTIFINERDWLLLWLTHQSSITSSGLCASLKRSFALKTNYLNLNFLSPTLWMARKSFSKRTRTAITSINPAIIFSFVFLPKYKKGRPTVCTQLYI